MEVVDRYLNRIKIKVSSLGVDLKNYFIQILFFNSYLNLKNTLIEKNLKKDIFLSIHNLCLFIIKWKMIRKYV